jgi:hypothetical protein
MLLNSKAGHVRKHLVKKEGSTLAVTRFLSHIKSGGKFKFFGLTLLFKLSQISLVKRIPFVYAVAKLPSNLLTAYEVENEHNLLPEPLHSKSLQLVKSEPLNIFFDYVVIGSGPGAAMATEMLQEGIKILLIEKGDFSKTPHHLHHTLTHVTNDFSNAGQELILARKLPQFAQGSTLGGGSEVNSGLFHRLPEPKKKNFLEKLGISESAWDHCEQFVESYLKVEKMAIALEHSLIYRGAQSLNLNVENIPRWRKYFKNGTFDHFGVYELLWKNFISKPNVTTLLQTTAVKIKSKKEMITISIVDAEGKKSEVRTKKLILAGGAIETPYLLAKSNLISWCDTRFQWHPMYRAIVSTIKTDLGFGDIDPVQAWPDDFLLKFGSAVSTPGLLALGLERRISIEEAQGLRSYYVSFSSSGRGGLVPGTRLPWYLMSAQDKVLSKTGREELEKLITAGGGKFGSERQKVSSKPTTVHIFGTLPVNSRIFLPGTCRLKVNPNIQVCDGSILPIGPGVNPQGVIMTTVRALFQP